MCLSQNVLAGKDAKRIIKIYNKVARTLVAFEYLWYQAWVQSIDQAKAGLQVTTTTHHCSQHTSDIISTHSHPGVANVHACAVAQLTRSPGCCICVNQATLIIRHPDDGKLYVNFDQEIMQLIREAKCLDRMGIEVRQTHTCPTVTLLYASHTHTTDLQIRLVAAPWSLQALVLTTLASLCACACAQIPESAKIALFQEEKFKAYFNELHWALLEYDRVVRAQARAATTTASARRPRGACHYCRLALV